MNTDPHPWVQEFPGAITVCDADGIILEMNDRSAQLFARDGGRELIGKSLFDCHPEPARTKLRQMMQERRVNVYTVEKNGIKRLIHQSPWFQDGNYAGFIEVGLEIPHEMPHFLRESSA